MIVTQPQTLNSVEPAVQKTETDLRVIRLRLTQDSPALSWTELVLLPDRGFNIFQLRYKTEQGEIDLMSSPSIEEAEKRFAGADPFGNLSYKMGGAFLIPYANRIRGQQIIPGKIRTKILQHSIDLPANTKGSHPDAEPHAMHGLILKKDLKVLKNEQTSGLAIFEAELDAGDFGVGWPSHTRLHFSVRLEASALTIHITGQNIGDEKTLMGIGWHPYFQIPSHLHAQATVVIPGRQRTRLNNYDDVFPTGALQDLEGSDFDFRPPQGRALKDQYLDDCFVDLIRADDGSTEALIKDPASHSILRIQALSPEVKAFQVYSPPDSSSVAIEPQFNWADSQSSIWPVGTDTGMVPLAPGESVRYSVRLKMSRI